MVNSKLTTDKEVLAAFKGSDADRRLALHYFFQNPNLRSWVTKYVLTRGGSESDAKDVFTESFIVFERQLRNEKFRGESSLETWFHAIAKWQWLAFKRKEKPYTDLEHVDLPNPELNPEYLVINDERKVILQKMIALVGERCQKLLGYFQLNYSMKEIRELMEYSSDQVAANQVHDCREKLKKVIYQNPEVLGVLKNRKNS